MDAADLAKVATYFRDDADHQCLRHAVERHRTLRLCALHALDVAKSERDMLARALATRAEVIVDRLFDAWDEDGGLTRDRALAVVRGEAALLPDLWD